MGPEFRAGRSSASPSQGPAEAPPFLIFDEATSNLEEETANAFAETINKLSGKVTILMIAHKLPRSIQATDIFLLQSEMTT